ncbi:hypothetical protein RWH43_00865 [Microbacterium sp. KSW2-21]|uniref:DUF222 domain-containing protein n=1 Tax=Microbacterium algihabitans TaxID=3075992 RepID=A0ABU3RRR3_9MICO|nr:hypothetical protein [Microbacterium sp. KSW2-21]MDU0325295.1 hypothetical protein [Microbacterium sp. KSW2-21]
MGSSVLEAGGLTMATVPTVTQLGLIEFAEACRGLDLEPPAAVTRGLALIDAAEAVATEKPLTDLLQMDVDDVAPLVAEVSLRRHVSMGLDPDGLGVGVEKFTAQVLREVRSAAVPDLDGLMEALRPQFDEFAKPLTVAAQKHGFTLATTSDDVINRSAEAIEAWRALRHAGAAMEPIAEFWRLTADVFGLAPSRRLNTSRQNAIEHQYAANISVCFAAGENWSLDGEYVTHEYRTHVDWLAVAREGLRLNTPSEVSAKVEARQKRNFQAGLRAAAAASAEQTEAQRETLRRGLESGRVGTTR